MHETGEDCSVGGRRVRAQQYSNLVLLLIPRRRFVDVDEKSHSTVLLRHLPLSKIPSTLIGTISVIIAFVITRAKTVLSDPRGRCLCHRFQEGLRSARAD